MTGGVSCVPPRGALVRGRRGGRRRPEPAARVARMSSGAANRHEPVTTVTGRRGPARAAPRPACRGGGGRAWEYSGGTRNPNTDVGGIDANWLHSLAGATTDSEGTIS